MKEPLPLWFIYGSDENGDNVDLFVAAPSDKEAWRHWEDYYGRERMKDTRIVRPGVSTCTVAGAIPWDDLPRGDDR